MNKILLASFSLIVLCACSHSEEVNLQDLTVGMNQYLAASGDLCLGKSNWPIDVTEREMVAGGRNAVQLPVLEKIGLVASTDTTADVKDEDKMVTVKVRRYALTDAGKKYYLTKEMRSLTPNGGVSIRQGDFCAVQLGLDKVIKWQTVKSDDGQKRALVTYTYKIINAAPWTGDADIQRVFPVVTSILHGAGTAQLQETLRMSKQGWIANEL